MLLGVTGSVAAVKAPSLALRLADAGCDVRVVLTMRGEHFWKLTASYDPKSWAAIKTVPGAHMGGLKPEFVTALDSCSVGGVQCVLRDADEWEAYTKVKVDSVLHIEVSPTRHTASQAFRAQTNGCRPCLRIVLAFALCQYMLSRSSENGRIFCLLLRRVQTRWESLRMACAMTFW